MSFGVLTVVIATMVASPARAGVGESLTFAQTALVTRWSLPLPSPKVGTMPQRAFAPILAIGTTTPNSASPFAASATPAAPDARSPSAAPTRPAGADGPTLSGEDLKPREAVTYDRKQPYRTPGDIKALEVTFQLLNAADAVTTVVCLNRDNCHERNPVFGKHPQPIVVVGAKAAVGALHYMAMRSLLPDYPGLARALGWASVTIQGTVVGLNLSQLF